MSRGLAPPLERAIAELAKLPGIGPKTAQRLAFHLLKTTEDDAGALARALLELRAKVRLCADCFHVTDAERCEICNDPRRDRTVLCVVEEPTNVMALERTSAYRGLYHVLGGALSPLRDVGPERLRIRELLLRLGGGGFVELILATSPNVEGEATAVYLARSAQPLGLRITRLAQGLPAGGDLEFIDDLTLRRAMEGRREY